MISGAMKQISCICGVMNTLGDDINHHTDFRSSLVSFSSKIFFDTRLASSLSSFNLLDDQKSNVVVLGVVVVVDCQDFSVSIGISGLVSLQSYQSLADTSHKILVI